VFQLGLDLWRSHVIQDKAIRQRLLNIMLDLVHKERCGEIIDRPLMRSVTQVCGGAALWGASRSPGRAVGRAARPPGCGCGAPLAADHVPPAAPGCRCSRTSACLCMWRSLSSTSWAHRQTSTRCGMHACMHACRHAGPAGPHALAGAPACAGVVPGRQRPGPSAAVAGTPSAAATHSLARPPARPPRPPRSPRSQRRSAAWRRTAPSTCAGQRSGWARRWSAWPTTWTPPPRPRSCAWWTPSWCSTRWGAGGGGRGARPPGWAAGRGGCALGAAGGPVPTPHTHTRTRPPLRPDARPGRDGVLGAGGAAARRQVRGPGPHVQVRRARSGRLRAGCGQAAAALGGRAGRRAAAAAASPRLPGAGWARRCGPAECSLAPAVRPLTPAARPPCSLFKRVEGGLALMRALMSDHAKESGRQLVLDPEKSREPVEYVQQLLDELDKYERIFVAAFGDDKTFRNALNQVRRGAGRGGAAPRPPPPGGALQRPGAARAGPGLRQAADARARPVGRRRRLRLAVHNQPAGRPAGSADTAGRCARARRRSSTSSTSTSARPSTSRSSSTTSCARGSRA
jgi:hypothetical protein